MKKKIDDGHRHDGDDPHSKLRSNLRVVRHVGDQRCYPHGKCKHLGLGDYNERPEERIPAPQKDENTQYPQGWLGKRENDLEVDPSFGGTIDLCTVYKFPRDFLHELTHQKDAKGFDTPWTEDPLIGVDPTKAGNELEQRNHKGIERNHDRADEKEENQVLAFEIVLGEYVSCK